MNRWSEQISKHPIHTLLGVMIEEAGLPSQSISPSEAIERARFLKVIRMISQVVSSLDADITPIDNLTNLYNTMSSHGLTHTIREYANTRDSALFHVANEQINPSLSYVYQLSSLKFSRSTKRADIDAASTSFAKFAELTHKKIISFENDIRISSSRVQDAAADIAEMKSRAEELSREFSAKLSTYENRTSEMLISHNEANAAAERDRLDEFAKLKITIKNDSELKFGELYLEMEVRAKEKQELLHREVDNIIKDGLEKHKSILELYQLVAADSVTGGHKRIADREYRQAQGWRWATIVLILTTIIWLGVNLFGVTPVLEPERLFWIQIVKTVSLTALLVSLAVYASKQSTLHRVNERKARSFFLQMQAFDPFIASLEEVERSALKVELSKRIFGPEDHSTDQKSITRADFHGIDKFISLAGQIRGIFGAK